LNTSGAPLAYLLAWPGVSASRAHAGSVCQCGRAEAAGFMVLFFLQANMYIYQVIIHIMSHNSHF
jgi:hypothetical protein